MNKTKILYISHTSQIGGAEICLLTLLKFIDRDEFEPVVIFPNKGPLKERVESLVVKTYICNLEWWVRCEGPLQRMGKILSDCVQGVVEIIDMEKPDIIHTNTSVICEGAIAARLKGIRHIWHLHEKLREHFAVIGLKEYFVESILLMKYTLGWKIPIYYQLKGKILR